MSDGDYEARLKTTGRNDRCPCGSGKKYKRCHLAEDDGSRTAALEALQAEAAARREASEATEGEVDAKGPDESTRARKRREDQTRSKGRPSGGKLANLPRRSAG